MFFWDLSHDFLADYYYKSSVFTPMTAKPHAASDPGQLPEASSSLDTNEGQSSRCCQTKHSHIPDAPHLPKMWCLWCAAQLPSAALLVLRASVQTPRLHQRRYSDLYPTKQEIQLTRDTTVKLLRNKNTYLFVCRSLNRANEWLYCPNWKDCCGRKSGVFLGTEQIH